MMGIVFVTVIAWIPHHGASYLNADSALPGGEERWENFKKVTSCASGFQKFAMVNHVALDCGHSTSAEGVASQHPANNESLGRNPVLCIRSLIHNVGCAKCAPACLHERLRVLKLPSIGAVTLQPESLSLFWVCRWSSCPASLKQAPS